jgi:geranylgeranyl diphosphate synthase type I
MKETLQSEAPSKVIAQVEVAMQELAALHANGIVNEAIGYHLATGGKRIRGRLAYAAFEALRVSTSPGLERAITLWAAACEMLHNGTLVHDDIQDGDRMRRNAATVWVKYGVSQAINVGDMMLMLPVLATETMQASAEVRHALALEVSRQAAQTVRGQAAELLLPQLISSSQLQHEYRRCIEQKTSSLFELPVFGAALLCGRELSEARRLSSAFTALGRLFQIQDDILDLFGTKGRGELGTDLKEGKVSALVVAHVSFFPGDAASLLQLLTTAREEVTSAQVDHWIQKFQSGGALLACCTEIEALSNQALGASLLNDEPALHGLLVEIIGMIREPILHVLKAQGTAV